MCPKQRRQKLSELSNKYRFAFFMLGTPTTAYNTMRLAAFISTKKPREYELFVEDDHKTLVFWNPYEKDSVEQS